MTLSFEAGVLPRLPKVRSYLRPIQVGQLLHRDMTHRLAGALQDSGRIVQVRATRESEEYVSSKYVDVADAVRDDSFRRAIQQNNLRAHLEDVLMARGHLLMDHFPKAQGKRLDAGIVPIEEFEQLARRSCHATLTSGDRSALGRYLCFHLVAQRFHRGREHVGADTFIKCNPRMRTLTVSAIGSLFSSKRKLSILYGSQAQLLVGFAGAFRRRSELVGLDVADLDGPDRSRYGGSKADKVGLRQ